MESSPGNPESFPPRAGYLDEGQTEVLLERARTEVFSVKQKLDNDLKQEKKKLRQKLIIRRRRELLQKVRRELRRLCSAQPCHTPPRIAVRGPGCTWRLGSHRDVPAAVDRL